MRAVGVACTQCGQPLERSWVFCGACGAKIDLQLPVAEPGLPEEASTIELPISTGPSSNGASHTQAPADPRNSQIRRRIILWVAFAALAALITEGFILHFQVRDRLEKTSADLAVTTADLDGTRAELEATTAERDELDSTLRDTRGELQGVRNTLGETEDRLELQAGDIEALKTCLSGVEEALWAYTWDAAFAALDAVRPSCDHAYSLF